MTKKFKAIEAATMPPIEVALFHSRKKLLRCLNDRGLQVELADVPGQTFTMEVDGTPISFVLLESERRLSWDDLALLTHEAVHVALRYFERIGEDDPGEEEFCYVAQAAAGCLFEAHLRWVKGKRKAQ